MSARSLPRALGAATLAFAFAAALPMMTACEEDGVVEGPDENAEHRCGPDFAEAKCGQNRCCSSSAFCGSLDQPHCGAQNGFAGAYDGARVVSSSGSVDCAGLCSRQAAVMTELECTQGRSEADCLTQCEAAASDPAASQCKAELIIQTDCAANAPTSDYSCPSEAGEAPSLSIDPGAACKEEVGDLLDCLFAN